MLRSLIACAAMAALAACSDQQASAPAKPAESAAAPAPATSAELAAYRPFLEDLWRPGPEITPDEVRKMVETDGAAKAVQTLTSGQDPEAPLPWTTVVSGIAHGEPEWLAVAPLLRPGTDGSYGEEYSMALTDALTTNPAGSLRLIAREEGGSDGYCLATDYETPPEQTRAYYTAAIANVETVSEPELQTIKAACLKQLREGAAQTPA